MKRGKEDASTSLLLAVSQIRGRSLPRWPLWPQLKPWGPLLPAGGKCLFFRFVFMCPSFLESLGDSRFLPLSPITYKGTPVQG